MNLPISIDRLRAQLQQSRILVVGDLMLDCYTWGDVRRISPEAPVPVVTVKVDQKTFRLGGAGNVAANLSGLGCTPAILGLIGDDAAAGRLTDLLAAAGIDNRCLIDTHRPTTTKTRIMAAKQQVLRVDEEDGNAIDDDTTRRILKTVSGLLPTLNAVVLSDYGKGMFAAQAFVQALIKRCQHAGVPVFVDPKGKDWRRYAGATCITPNTAELEWATGRAIDSDDQLTATARALRQQLSLTWLLVTRGPKGMALFGDDPSPVLIASRAREVFDVSGAGDTVIATLAACVAADMAIADAASVANTAAGIVVGKVGTWAIQWAQLQKALAELTGTGPANPLSKVADRDEAIERIAHWRQSEQCIVFTNGCFDLLHSGHVSLLHQARQLGDRLIVGLNTDASIRRLKGDRRPIRPGKDRATILSALEDVDLVVFFDDDTPLSLIDQLKPDVLVKGADYRIEDVVGKEIVESYGGRVCLVNLLAGHSTTAITRKMSADT